MRRDATAWVHLTIAETALDVVGILAGINRRYFVPFQFKRARRFLETMQIAPDNVAEVFGWLKSVGGFRRTRYRGLARTQLAGYLVAAAYNLVRMARLMAIQTVTA